MQKKKLILFILLLTGISLIYGVPEEFEYTCPFRISCGKTTVQKVSERISLSALILPVTRGSWKKKEYSR